MKTVYVGRIVFGASAVLYGVIALLWHDAGTWQGMSAIWRLPAGSAIGALLMIAQVAGGVALMVPRFATLGSRILALVYALFAVSCIPGIIKQPMDFDGFFEQLSLVSGAIAMFNFTFARLGLGISAISFTVTQYVYIAQTAQLVPRWIPPNQLFWAWLTTAFFAFATIAMLIDVKAKLAMRLMGLMTGLFGLIVWVPILIAKPDAHFAWSEFALTMLITGATWTISEQ